QSPIFLGKVISSRINNTDNIHKAVIENNDDIIYPNIEIKLMAMYDKNTFVLPGDLTVGIGDKAYICNDEAIKKYINSLEINKRDNQIEFSSFNLNEKKAIPFKISVDGLFNHHFMIVGATNSGKSTSALAILDKYQKLKGKFLIIDPTGEYKDAFSKNEVNLKTIGKNLFLNTANLTDEQWISLFRPNDNSQVIELLEAIKKLKFVQYYKKHLNKVNLTEAENRFIRNDILDCEGANQEQYKHLQIQWESDKVFNESFDINNLDKQIEKDSLKLSWNKGIKQGTYQFDYFTYGANSWLIRKVKYLIKTYNLKELFLNVDSKTQDKDFGETDKGKKILKDLNKEMLEFQGNDISLYIRLNDSKFSIGLGQVIVDYISNFLLNHDMTKHPTLLFVDEVHRYALEKDAQDDFISPLATLAREGRKNGIFLFLTTQSPKDVPTIVLNQIGTLLMHRLTGEYEIKAINNFLNKDKLAQLSSLKSGEAILTSVNLMQPVNLNIKASGRTHYSNTPKLIKIKND
ncbi:ATP-binding protein, partial [Lactobacillus crispatus]